MTMENGQFKLNIVVFLPLYPSELSEKWPKLKEKKIDTENLG